MSSFEEKVQAFNIGMSFQEDYAREIDSFRLFTVNRLRSGEPPTPAQASVLLTLDPISIDRVLTSWSKAVSDSRDKLRRFLANYLIVDAYMQQRSWSDGQWRIYGEVLDMYALPDSELLRAPDQVNKQAVAAIRRVFPVNIESEDPLGGAAFEFEAQLRARGNPWIGSR